MVLKEIIQSKGFKQKYLADRLGVSEVTLSNWVKGKTKPSPDNLKRLSELLDVSLEVL